MHCVKFHFSWRLNECQLFYQVISTSCVGCCSQFGKEGSLKKGQLYSHGGSQDSWNNFVLLWELIVKD